MRGAILISLTLLFLSSCDGVGVGSKRAILLNPEERQLVQDFRDGKTVAVSTESVKPVTKSRGISVTKSPEQAQEERSRALIRPTAMLPAPELAEKDGWQFKWSWDKGVATPGKPSADNPEYDDDGNLIVSPDIVRGFKIPDIHSGVSLDINGENKIRALLEIEACEFKLPKFGWFSSGMVVGEQFAGWHLSKEFVRIFDIEAGIYIGKDFETDDVVWGINGLIIKF